MSDHIEKVNAVQHKMADGGLIQHTVESLRAEIDRIVAERQELRRQGATPAELEANRERLVRAQSQLSDLLIKRYLPRNARAA